MATESCRAPYQQWPEKKSKCPRRFSNSSRGSGLTHRRRRYRRTHSRRLGRHPRSGRTPLFWPDVSAKLLAAPGEASQQLWTVLVMDHGQQQHSLKTTLRSSNSTAAIPLYFVASSAAASLTIVSYTILLNLFFAERVLMTEEKKETLNFLHVTLFMYDCTDCMTYLKSGWSTSPY